MKRVIALAAWTLFIWLLSGWDYARRQQKYLTEHAGVCIEGQELISRTGEIYFCNATVWKKSKDSARPNANVGPAILYNLEHDNLCKWGYTDDRAEGHTYDAPCTVKNE
jgi:hypothetical protein